MFVLGSRGSPGVVEFETLIAEVGLAVSAALTGLQRLRGLTETTHDGDAAQTYCVPVPKGQTGGQGDKGRAKAILQQKRKQERRSPLRQGRLSSSEFALLSFQ